MRTKLSRAILESLQKPTVLTLKISDEDRETFYSELLEFSRKIGRNILILSSIYRGTGKLYISESNIIRAFNSVLTSLNPPVARLFAGLDFQNVAKLLDTCYTLAIENYDKQCAELYRALSYLIESISKEPTVQGEVSTLNTCPPDNITLFLLLEALNNQTQGHPAIVVIDCPLQRYDPAILNKHLTTTRNLNPIILLE